MNKIGLHITSLIIVLSSVSSLVLAVGSEGDIGVAIPKSERNRLGMGHGPVKAPTHHGMGGANHPKGKAPAHVTRGVNRPGKGSVAQKGYPAGEPRQGHPNNGRAEISHGLTMND